MLHERIEGKQTNIIYIVLIWLYLAKHCEYCTHCNTFSNNLAISSESLGTYVFGSFSVFRLDIHSHYVRPVTASHGTVLWSTITLAPLLIGLPMYVVVLARADARSKLAFGGQDAPSYVVANCT